MDARLNTALETAVKEKKLVGVGAIVIDKDGNSLYKGAFGTVNGSDPNAAPFTTSTPYIAWSITKIITCIAALQLVEQGKLKLEDPVEKYLPKIKEVKVLAGWNEDGTPQLREAKNKPTIINLLTHTAGFTYDWLNPSTLRYRMHTNIPPGSYGSGAYEPFFESPYDYDPGTSHAYSISIDWLGFVIEAITGQKLPEYIKANILDPLGMKDTGPRPEHGTKGVDTNLLVHHRSPEDGSLTADPNIQFPVNPAIHGGGHYLYSTLEDYAEKFLLTLLNYCTNPKTGVSILKKETAQEYLFKEKIESVVGVSAGDAGVVVGSIPQITNDGEFMPGLKKSWSYGLLLNLEDSPIGRSAGSGCWAGLGNIFYW